MPLDQQTGLDDDPAALVTEVLGDLVRPASLAPADPGPAVVTGTYVSDPPFFGGGDVGRLAVSGVVNSLVTGGAEPRSVALALTVEAGLPRRLLLRLAESVRDTARQAGVGVAAVHGRVVRAGDADQVYVTATGLGVPPASRTGGVGPEVRAGDRVLVSGPLGDHEAHLLSLRAGLGFEHHVTSACAPLTGLLGAVRSGGYPGAVRAAAEINEGGLAAALRSFGAGGRAGFRIDEHALPVRAETRVALESLGVAPWDAASPGRLCLVVAPDAAPAVLSALRSHPYGRSAALVGHVTGTAGPRGVVLESAAPDGTVTPLPAPVPAPARRLF
ncbi:AIR synthase-related protein [Streptomyces globisporus]|uniref:AIR synthase-related protein n=1 Tax=Streptomyces globisporus TaxID=1908 RepID=UPI000559D730|nr:AIR synthase-related protein [Streptomyces globisporus]